MIIHFIIAYAKTTVIMLLIVILYAYLGTFTEEYRFYIDADTKGIVPLLHYGIPIAIVLLGIVFTIPLSLISYRWLKKEKTIIRIILYISLASVASLLSALHNSASIESVSVIFYIIGITPTLVEIVNGKLKTKTA
jgi:uncharacterized membrane-anchored protein YitT (DUF2179 family)